MKRRATHLLLLRDGAYRVLRCDGSAVSAGDAHPTIAAALAGVEKGGIVLATPSNWSLCGTVDRANLPRARRQAMVYRLEEQLPLSAEDVVADFIEADQTALGVAGQLRLLQPAVAEATAAGFAIDAVVPAALLAGQGYLHRKQPDGVLMFEQDGQIELLQLADGVVTGWDTLPADADDLAVELGVRALRGPIAVTAGPLPVELKPIEGVTVTPADLPLADDAAARAAYAIARQGVSPIVDLYRDPLGSGDALRGARPAVRAAVAAAVLLLIAVFGGILWRASAYHRLAADYEAQQQAIFTQTFPGKPLNTDLSVATQLLREERRLRGLAGGDGGDVPARVSSLALLHRVLAAMPEGQCRVNELDVKEDRLTLEATVANHTDVEVIYKALAADKGLEVSPPLSERLPDGQSTAMTLTATAATPAKGGVR